MSPTFEAHVLLKLVDSRMLYRVETWQRTGTLFVSNSVLKSQAACSTKAWLEAHGYRAIEDEGGSAPREAGVASHVALATAFRGAPKAQALADFDTAYREYSERFVAADDRLAHAEVRDVLAAWFARYERQPFPFAPRPQLVEIPFLWPLSDDGHIVIAGRIDAIVADDADCLYVLDHKTTGRLDARFIRSFRLDAQFSTYQWGTAQHTERPVVGGIVNAIELKSLPKSDGKCRQGHGGSYSECRDLHLKAELIGPITHTTEFLEQWRHTAMKLAHEYEETLALPSVLDADQRGQFNGACTDCDFADFCDAARPLHAIDTLLEKTPYEGVEAEA